MNKKFSKIMLTSASALALFAAYPSVAQNANEALGLDLETITAEAATAAGRNFIDRVMELPNVSEIAEMTPEGIQEQSRQMDRARRAYEGLSAADKDATVERWENFLYQKERAIGNVFIDIVMNLHNVAEIEEFNTEDFAAEQQRARRARNQYNDLADVAKANLNVVRWLEFLELKEQPLGITFVDLVQLVPNVETLNNLTEQDLAAAVKAYETAKASYDKLPDAAKKDALVVRWAGFLEEKADAIRDEIENGEETPAELTVNSVSAINETTLLVIMSDGSPHEVVLENNQKLVPNVNTPVSFAVDGEYYTAEVIYTEKSAELEQEILEAQAALNQARDNYSDALNDLEQANTDLSNAERYNDADSEEVLAAEEAVANAELNRDQTWTRLDRAADKLYSLLQGTDYAVAYEKVVAAVEKAERSKNQIDVNLAWSKITALRNEDGAYDDAGRALGDRLKAVEAEIKATGLVVDLENTLAEDGIVSREAINNARAHVELMQDGDAKVALLARVDAVLEVYEAAAAANEAATKALNTPTAENIAAARPLVDALEDSDFKDTLLDKLERAQAYVERADFIEEVQELLNVAEIKDIMDPAVLVETEEALVSARATYNALSTENKEHADVVTWENALTEKEEALSERKLDLADYLVAEVEKAAGAIATEGDKVDATNAVNEAQVLVDTLDDGAKKSEYNRRLIVVRTTIEVAETN